MDLEDKPSAVDVSRYVPRVWFFGGFTFMSLLSVVQIIISSVALNGERVVVIPDTTQNIPEIPDTPQNIPEIPEIPETPEKCPDTTEKLTGDAGYTFDILAQSWATGPEGKRPPGFEGRSWQDVVNEARGTTVTWAADQRYMGGNEETHNYVPFLTKELKENYDITLNFKNMPTASAVAEAQSQGGIDFIWLNKNNYLNLKESSPKLTWGPYADVIPNAALFNFQDDVITTDFGVPTNGEEMPLHVAHYVMVYDEDNKPTTTTPFPPRTIGDLVAQVNDGEISFHPSDPKSFLGTPFLELVFYHYAGEDAKKFREPFDQQFWDEIKAKVFGILKKFHEKLFVFEDRKYSKPPVVRQLFKEGKVHLSAEYAPGAVYNQIQNGGYPAKATAYIFDEKMPANTNFLTIVGNGPNKAGAMVAINLASSMEHQYKRYIPNTGSWKGFQAFSPFKTPVTSVGWNTVFDEIETFESAPSYEELIENSIGEFNKEYFERMVADFDAEIGTGMDPLTS